MIFKARKSDRRYASATSADEVQQMSMTKQTLEYWHSPKELTTCPTCSTKRGIEEFYIMQNNPLLYTLDTSDRKHTFLCKTCVQNIAKRLQDEYYNGNQYKALYKMCSVLGFYYDDTLAHKIWEEDREYEDGTPVSPFISPYDLYFRAVQDDPELCLKDPLDPGMTDWDHMIDVQKQTGLIDSMPEQARKDRKDVIEKFHFDVFEDEPIEDRPRLYSDLLTMYDDAMSSDLVKQRAAIEIVKSFYRIDIIGKTVRQLQSTPEKMVENSKVLKELIDQKTKETTMVTNFSKDHGFAERYQQAKSRGSGTLSSIVRDGKETHFDKLAVNKFDIDTSVAMQQVANMSAQAMLSQIQLTGEDYKNMIEDQSIEIRKLQSQVAELKESNRLLREKQVKQELYEEYCRDMKRKGITPLPMSDLSIFGELSETFYPAKPEDES